MEASEIADILHSANALNSVTEWFDESSHNSL